jgi:putative phosphoesterase
MPFMQIKNLVGLLADSHDNTLALKKAVELFNRMGCSLVIHAGDFIAPFAARELESLQCPVRAVFGNCDGEKAGLKHTIRSFGQIREAPFLFRHDSLRFLVTHVDTPIKSHLNLHRPDILVFGHTHKAEIKNWNQTLLINPGEAGGWVTGKSTVAVLDTKTRAAEITPLLF